MLMLSNDADSSMRQMTEMAITTAYDNRGSDDIILYTVVVETNKFSPAYFQDNKFIFTVWPKEEFNYNRFLNLGYAASREWWLGSFLDDFFGENNENKFVVIANNDLIFHENWLISLISGLEDNNLDSVSPLSLGWQFHQNYNHEWRVHRGWGIGYEFCGWCLMFKKDVYDKLYPLDERFEFFCQDNDIALRMQKKGMIHALISNSFVTHLVSQSHKTIGNNFRRFTNEMIDKFNQKINNGEYERD